MSGEQFAKGLVVSVFGALAFLPLVGMTDSPGTPAPPPITCKVNKYDCRTVNGFCVNELEVPGNPPTTRYLKECDNGVTVAGPGENGHRNYSPPTTKTRQCRSYASTTMWDCNSPPPGGGYTKLASCGTSTSGQCCYGSGRVTVETLDNSYQESLQDTACTGPSTPVTP